MRRSLWIMLVFWLAMLVPTSGLASEGSGFTQEDRERLIRLETTLQVFMDQTNRRFEDLRTDMNKRFEEMREDANNRFAEMRQDTNKRFEELRGDMNKRFEQMDKRFEQVDKRFEQMMTFLWILVGIFTALTMATIGFAYWDRRTMIRKAREETIQIIEKDGRLTTLIQALRTLSADNPKLAAALRSYGFL